MKRLRPVATGLLVVGSAVAAPVGAAAPADASELVGTLSNQHVELALTHAETVQLYNDPLAVNPLCWKTWNDLQSNRVFTPAVTYFSCLHDVAMCVQYAVAGGAQTTGVTWVWRDGAAYSCNPVW